jgi:hypothetical protein
MRRFLPTIFLTILSASVLADCAGVSPPRCAPGLRPMVEAQLFFGRNTAGRAPVSEEEWRRFLDEEVTRRFPDGFSAADVYGQWRDAAGTIVREPSKELVIVLPRVPADAAKLDIIRDAYKRRFQQESVLRVDADICAAF